MGIFSSLDRKQKEAIGLLQIGTFLEYFDLMLYVHMAVLLNELFFPKTDPHTASLLSAFAFCSSFLLRPFGALIFGYIGDNIGRRATVVITTFLMAVSCIIMATLPTYAQIGIAASWIVTLCRIVQGLSSLGEVVGAQLYLTESIKPPAQFPVVALVGCFATLGAVAALGIATLATSYGLEWRIAFYIGAGVALVGAFARNRLRETPEFADAKQRIKRAFEKAKAEPKALEQNPIYTARVSKKTSLAYFLIQCSWPIAFYFTYIYCGGILKNNLAYTGEQIISHNFLVSLFQFGRNLSLSFLSIRFHPLKILKSMLWVFSGLVLIGPFVLQDIQSAGQLFLFQVLIVCTVPGDLPAIPIFYKHFPVFKRFTYASFLYAISRALIYFLTSFGLVYMVKYLGHWGTTVLMLPVAIGYGFAITHFEKLEKTAPVIPARPLVEA